MSEHINAAPVGRSTWMNTIVGMLDMAFNLSDEELFFCNEIVRQLLVALRVPERGAPACLPAAVALESAAGLYSQQMHGARDAGLMRNARVVGDGDVVVTLEAWRQALMNLLTSAYTDLDDVERMAAASTLDQLLIGIGVPNRAANHLPNDVVRAHIEGA